MDYPELLSTLYHALAEPIGLLIASDNPKQARNWLYQARVKANDPALAQLQIRFAPQELAEEGQLVVVKGPRPQQLPAVIGAKVEDLAR